MKTYQASISQPALNYIYNGLDESLTADEMATIDLILSSYGVNVTVNIEDEQLSFGHCDLLRTIADVCECTINVHDEV